MDTTKPFWASKTLWINLVALVVAVSTAFGVDLGISPEEQTAFVGGVMAVVNIVLRLVSGTRLTSGGS